MGGRLTGAAVHRVAAAGRRAVDARKLEAALADGIEQPAPVVLVDLTGRSEIDSAALGTLLRAERTLSSHGRGLAIVASHPEIVRRIRLTGIDRRVELTVAAAEPAPQAR